MPPTITFPNSAATPQLTADSFHARDSRIIQVSVGAKRSASVRIIPYAKGPPVIEAPIESRIEWRTDDLDTAATNMAAEGFPALSKAPNDLISVAADLVAHMAQRQAAHAAAAQVEASANTAWTTAVSAAQAANNAPGATAAGTPAQIAAAQAAEAARLAYVAAQAKTRVAALAAKDAAKPLAT